MKKTSFFKLLVARIVNYAVWLLVLTLIEDQSSLSLSQWMLWLLAPFMMVFFGALSTYYFKSTIGFKLLGIDIKPPIGWKDAFIAALPWTRPKKLIENKKIPKWRYLTACAIALTSLVLQFNDPVYGFSSSSSMINSSWVQYTHEQKGFTVYFPDEPKEAKKPLTPTGETGLNITEMSSKEKKRIYSLSFIKLPKKWGLAGDNTILKVALDLIVTHTPNAKLVSKQITNYKGLKAIDYTIVVDGKEESGRLLMHGNTLYRLNVEFPQGSKIAKEEFLSSFSVS